jgi:hypothetical protein
LNARRQKLVESSRKAKIAKNNALNEGLVLYPVSVKQKYTGAVSDYCNILRYGTQQQIDDCRAFMTMMNAQLPKFNPFEE